MTVCVPVVGQLVDTFVCTNTELTLHVWQLVATPRHVTQLEAHGKQVEAPTPEYVPDGHGTQAPLPDGG